MDRSTHETMVLVEPLSEEGADVTASSAVRTRDGERLATDIYLPAGLGPWPTVLIKTPYDKGARSGYKPQMAIFLADRGYATVVQDVRGRGRSTGAAVPLVHETLDGYDTIDWIIGRPWSNGNVGMVGGSYCALTQWAAAASAHPALKAIAPAGIAVNATMPVRHQGIPWLTNYAWFIDSWSFPTLIKGGAWTWSGHPLIDSVPDWAPRGRRLLESWLAAPGDVSYHLGRIYPDGSPTTRLRIPAFHSTGWWDVFTRDMMTDWAQLLAYAPAADAQCFQLRAADHHYPYLPDGQAPDDHWNTDDAALERLLPEELGPVLEFFDRYLRGSNRVTPFPRLRYEVANGPSGVADRWPPPGAFQRQLQLVAGDRALSSAEGGGLRDAPDKVAQRVRWEHNPESPVPSLVESEWDPLRQPVDEADNHRRPDVATFTTESLTDSLDLCGPMGATLVLESSGPSTHIFAVLSDVAPNGRAQLIAYGASHVSFDNGPARIGVDLGTTGYRVRPQHRLRLAVSSSLFPRYAVHLGTDDDPVFGESCTTTEHALHIGGPSGSSLNLTVGVGVGS